MEDFESVIQLGIDVVGVAHIPQQEACPHWTKLACPILDISVFVERVTVVPVVVDVELDC